MTFYDHVSFEMSQKLKKRANYAPFCAQNDIFNFAGNMTIGLSKLNVDWIRTTTKKERDKKLGAKIFRFGVFAQIFAFWPKHGFRGPE